MLQSCIRQLDDTTACGEGVGMKDKEMVKLYYSILSNGKKNNLQDKNRDLQSSPLTTKERLRPKTPFYEIRESPIARGRSAPLSVKYVYLSQNKPHPIEPLKAWKGYNGNLYFQPITINSWSSGITHDSRHDYSLPSTSYSCSRSQPTPRQSRASWSETALLHPAVRLEKEAVISRLSMTLSTNEDEEEQCPKRFGTLILGPPPSRSSASNKKPHLCKGSMAHQQKIWKDSRGTTYGYRYTLKGTPSSAKSTLLIANKATCKNSLTAES